jgi:hypothetical protein
VKCSSFLKTQTKLLPEIGSYIPNYLALLASGQQSSYTTVTTLNSYINFKRALCVEDRKTVLDPTIRICIYQRLLSVSASIAGHLQGALVQPTILHSYTDKML